MFKGPPVQLICPKDLHFAYVPGHLSHICFELLKNSLHAVVERYWHEKEDAIPPIKVVVIEGKEDITIKISDEGGGITLLGEELQMLPRMVWRSAHKSGVDQALRTPIECCCPTEIHSVLRR
jgi:hypothetical protein